MAYKVKCSCKHKHQDELYGANIRVANPTTKAFPDGTLEVRCTVCNAIHKVKK
jgi:hypothetical protein